jgi:hypothetical protein
LFQGNGNINATINLDDHVMVGWGQTMEGLLVLLRPFLADGVDAVNALKGHWHRRRHERAGTAPEPTYVISNAVVHEFLTLLFYSKRDNTKRDADRQLAKTVGPSHPRFSELQDSDQVYFLRLSLL